MCGITRRNMVCAIDGKTQICTSLQCITANASASQPALSNQGAQADHHLFPRHGVYYATSWNISISWHDGIPLATSTSSGIVLTTYIQWAQVTFNCLNPWAQARNLPTSSLSSSALAAYENGGPGISANNEKITICWQFRISKNPKTLDSDLGLVSRRWSANMFMTGMLEFLLHCDVLG